jgi:hypothetical protein
LLMFTSIFGYRPGSGSETLELRIRIRQKFRILADSDPDPQHWWNKCPNRGYLFEVLF